MTAPYVKRYEGIHGEVQVSRGDDTDTIGVLVVRDGKALAAVLTNKTAKQLADALVRVEAGGLTPCR